MAAKRPYPPVAVVDLVVAGVQAHIADPDNPKFDSETGANILRHWRLFCEYLLEREAMQLSCEDEVPVLSWKPGSRKRKSPEAHFTRLLVDSKGQAFSEYLSKRFTEVKPATVRTETSSLRACIRILQAAGETEFRAEDLLNPSVAADPRTVVPFTEEMVAQAFGLQSLQLATRRDIGVYVAFIREHVSPTPSWKQEVAASKRLRRVKRRETRERLAKEAVVIETVTGQMIFCAAEWTQAFLEYVQPNRQLKQVIVAIQKYYRWLAEEGLCDFDAAALGQPLRLRDQGIFKKPLRFRSGCPVKQFTGDESAPQDPEAAATDAHVSRAKMKKKTRKKLSRRGRDTG